MSDSADELPSAYLRDVLVRASSVAVPAFETHEAYLLQLRGTPPELILQKRNVSEAIKKAEQYSAPSVEEHLLDFDWPFSDASLKSLSTKLGGMKSALVLGAPSIALSLRSRPLDLRRLLVIDRNPFRGGEESSQLDVRFDEILPCGYEPFDVCIFDAPWYPTDLKRWLWQAIQAVRINGTVLFSLWPELTRPTAKEELIRILDSISNLGDVSIDEGAISYSVPCFERWSYARLGISLSHPWRTGDLVTLIKKRAWLEPPPKAATEGGRRWHRFLNGKRQIAVREGEEAAVPSGLQAWALNSVSRRSPERSMIDIWTSRNVVARTRTSGNYLNALYSLARRTVSSRTDDKHATIIEELRCLDFLTDEPLDRQVWSHLD